MGAFGNDAVALLHGLADRIEKGGDPLLELAGSAEETACILRQVAGELADRQTVGEHLCAVREKDGPGGQIHTWLGDRGKPEMSGDVLTFHIGPGTDEPHDRVGWYVGLLPYGQLSHVAITVGGLLEGAYDRGRDDVRREAQDAARGVLDVLGIVTRR